MAIKNQPLTLTYLAWDSANGVGKTGDAANHTLRLVADGALVTPAASPVQVDASILPGTYKIALTAAEMNYNCVTLGGVSSTGKVTILPMTVVTERGAFSDLTTQVGAIPNAGESWS